MPTATEGRCERRRRNEYSVVNPDFKLQEILSHVEKKQKVTHCGLYEFIVVVAGNGVFRLPTKKA